MLKARIHKDRRVINTYAPNNTYSTYANQKLSMIQGERDGISLSVQNQRKNINKDIEDRNNIIIGCLFKKYI